MSQPPKDNAGVITLPPLIYLGPLLLGLWLNRKFPAPFLPPKVGRVAGWGLIGLATLIESWFILTMQRARTPIDPRKPVAHLTTDGPFRFSRNPSYVAYTFWYVGISSIVNARWPMLLLPAVLGVVQRGVIEREERYLQQKFGGEYSDYNKRVRRWL